MRRYIKLFAEWTHSTLLLALLIPVIYAVGMRQEVYVEKLLYVKCLFIAFPIIVTDIAMKRLRSLWLYLLVCLVTFLAVGAGAFKIFVWDTGSGIMWGCVVILLIETLFVMIGHISERLEKHGNENTPSFGVLAVFAGAYVLGRGFYSPSVCNEALFSFIVYLFAVILYKYIEGTEEYLSLNKRVKNISAKRVYGISRSVLMVFLLLMLLAVLPSVLTINQRRYTDFRVWLQNREIDYGELEIETQRSTQAEDPMQEMLEALGAPIEPPKWLEAAFQVIGIAVIAGFLLAVLRSIIKSFHIFRENYDENGDVVEALEGEKLRKNGIGEYLFPKDTEKEKIRRKYRKTIRKHRKEKPYSHETPYEMENIAGIAETDEIKALHAEYEQARYGR